MCVNVTNTLWLIFLSQRGIFHQAHALMDLWRRLMVWPLRSQPACSCPGFQHLQLAKEPRGFGSVWQSPHTTLRPVLEKNWFNLQEVQEDWMDLKGFSLLRPMHGFYRMSTGRDSLTSATCLKLFLTFSCPQQGVSVDSQHWKEWKTVCSQGWALTSSVYLYSFVYRGLTLLSTMMQAH